MHAVLGQGGSGVVYDAAWGPRRVALKVLHAELVATDKARSQFFTEAQRLQQIGHPAVVKVLGVGTLPDGRPFLAMERLDGETLAALIARGAIAPGRALGLFGELCGAVSALHDRGLIHRDLKPENVFVTAAGGHAVLLDFGIAKDLAAPASTTTQEGHVRGTPAYMAPERFFGQPAGLATDVYELALVLYAMLAGRLPWLDGADPEARLSPLPLAEIAGVPEALDVEIRRALSTRAQNRPGSAAALLAEVTAAVGADVPPSAGETARMRPGATNAPGLAEQATPLAWAPTQAAPTGRRPARRWRWVVGALAVIATAGGLAYVRIAPKAAAVIAAERGSSAVPRSDAPAPAYDPADPWSARPAAIAKAIPLVGEEQSIASYRAAAANAIAHLAADTNVVIAVQIAELRANTVTADVLKKIGASPKVKLAVGDLPACVRELASESAWIVYGSPRLDAGGTGAVVVGGRWTKHDVVACFEGDEKKTLRDGSTLVRIADDGWLDFLDDHTAYLVIQKGMTAEALHALVEKKAGAAPATRALIAKLPAERSIAFVFGARAKVDWASLLRLPNGSDVYGWARIYDRGMELDAGADARDDQAARAAAAILTPQIEQMFSSNEGAGKLVVARRGTEVHVEGRVTTFALSLFSAALDR